MGALQTAAPLPPRAQADLAIPPLKIVGYEGLFGSFFMLCLMLPLVQRLPGQDGQGIHEDSLDTLHVRRPQGIFIFG